MGRRGTVDSVARGVRFWQLVRLGIAGRAWGSLLGVFGGNMGRARMAWGRCECGRRCARLVIQKVGVIQHSSFRGKLGRQELVGKVVVWGKEGGGGRSVVCVGPVASRLAILCLWRYAGCVGGSWRTSSGVWECEADGPACNKDPLRMAEVGSAFDGLAYVRLAA